MSIIAQLSYYMNILIVATILVAVVLGAAAFYLLKVKKLAATEEKIDYNNFNRTSTMDYVKFDDIVSDNTGQFMSGAGMIVTNGKEFTSGIDIAGYNFAYASAAEQQQTIVNSVAATNIIEHPIQVRRTVEAVDVSHNIEQFEEARKNALLEYEELYTRYNELIEQAENMMDEPEVQEVILSNMEEIEVKLHSAKWKAQEADEIVSYEKKIQEKSTNSKKVAQILFTYKYNPDEITEELTEEEIYVKAMQELSSKAQIYSSALAACGCMCRPLTAEKLVALMRRHLHPITADAMPIEEMLDSSISSLFITSDSLMDITGEVVKEKMYEETLRQYQAELEQKVQQAETVLEEERQLQKEMLKQLEQELLNSL